MAAWTTLPAIVWIAAAAILLASYAIGSIPWAWIIVCRVTGQNITEHGTGNVGAMNVKRSTGSWGWFAVAMVADGLKGLVPVIGARALGDLVLAEKTSGPGAPFVAIALMQAAMIGALLGHNYSLWMALLTRRFARTGKGLATGAGALLAYNPLYFAVVLVVGIATLGLTRYLMAGQVAAAAALPVFAIITRRPDWPFTLLVGAIVYSAHHRRFVGMLHGDEPRLYVSEGSGRPRG